MGRGRPQLEEKKTGNLSDLAKVLSYEAGVQGLGVKIEENTDETAT